MLDLIIYTLVKRNDTSIKIDKKNYYDVRKMEKNNV